MGDGYYICFAFTMLNVVATYVANKLYVWPTISNSIGYST